MPLITTTLNQIYKPRHYRQTMRRTHPRRLFSGRRPRHIDAEASNAQAAVGVCCIYGQGITNGGTFPHSKWRTTSVRRPSQRRPVNKRYYSRRRIKSMERPSYLWSLQFRFSPVGRPLSFRPVPFFHK